MLPSTGFKTSSCHMQAQCPKLEFVTFFQFTELQTLFVTPQLCLSEETVNSQNKDLVLFISVTPSYKTQGSRLHTLLPSALFFSSAYLPSFFPFFSNLFPLSFFLPSFPLFSLFLFLLFLLSLMSFPLLPFYLKTLIGFYALCYDLWNPYYLPLLDLQTYRRDSHAHSKVQHYLMSSLWKQHSI